MATRGDTYVTNIRTSVKAFWESYLFLLSQQEEWNAQDYGTTLAAQLEINSDVTAAQVGSAVFDAMNAVNTVMDAGNATNLTNVL
jgi:hypothetical protein